LRANEPYARYLLSLKARLKRAIAREIFRLLTRRPDRRKKRCFSNKNADAAH
jgi:hypothetical protein